MNIWILIMVLGDYKHSSVVQVEFNSFATCEAARIEIAKVHGREEIDILSQGCYPK